MIYKKRLNDTWLMPVSGGERRARKFKAWGYRCPICLTVLHSRYYKTRKQAKDGLHEHMKTKHPAGPDLGV